MEAYEEDDYFMNGGAAEEEQEEDELPEGGDENAEDLDENIEEEMADIEEDGDEDDEDPATSGDEGPVDLLEYKDQSDDESTSEEEEDDSDDEEYENRVDEEYKQRFMKSIHPEEFHDNYNFIKMMTSVERDDLNLIHDSNHITLPILTKYEKARILGLRISQLNKGSKPYIENKNHHIVDMHIIAEQELKEKRLPFIIMRPIPNGKKEYWKLEDLEIIEN